jgi:pimeloyl-ACP methyl ester carboxylesterase
VAGTSAAAAAGLYRVRRERRRPDPDRGEPLAERPGVEQRIASFDGTELAVNVVGPASRLALVFVHGFSLNLTTWHYQWKRFAQDHRVVLYDQRGHGRSAPAAGGDYSLEALGRDLHAVLDATVAAGPAVVIGHSMGGMSILSLAAQFPDEFGTRVRGVVLTNTAASDLFRAMLGNLGARAGGFLFPAIRRLAANPERAYRLRSQALGRGADLAYLIARSTNFGPDASPALVDYLVSVAADTPAEVWTDVMTSLIELDLADAIEHVRVPALVVAGDLDRLTPPATALAIKRRLPEARMVVFRGTGHCPMLERHEQFNEVLSSFLGEVQAKLDEGHPSVKRTRRGAKQ